MERANGRMICFELTTGAGSAYIEAETCAAHVRLSRQNLDVSNCKMVTFRVLVSSNATPGGGTHFDPDPGPVPFEQDVRVVRAGALGQRGRGDGSVV